MGFEEAQASFEIAANVAVLSPGSAPNPALSDALQKGLRLPIRMLDANAVLRDSNVVPIPDLFVIDGAKISDHRTSLFGLVSDLRSRADTRLATLLVIVPDAAHDLGAMFLDLGADDIAMASASAGEIALRAKALTRRKLLHDRLRDTVRNGLNAAVTDPLTGLYNRRYAEPHLARMAQQAGDAGREFAEMMLDLDHFKAVNDTYGHAAGDRVLVQVAERLRENMRAIDLVARVGGEEFLIAMPRTPPAQAHSAANRLRRLINCRPFDLGGEAPPLRVTVSVGVAVSGPDGIQKYQPAQMCDRADAALYAAKSAGRDQVAMSKSAA